MVPIPGPLKHHLSYTLHSVINWPHAKRRDRYCTFKGIHRHAYLQAAATVPASFVVSPGLQSPACTLLCLTTWGSEAAGNHSSKQWQKDVFFYPHLYDVLAKCPAVRMRVCSRRWWESSITSGCEGLSGLFALWSSLGTVVSILGGLRKQLSSCCWLNLRLWKGCCFCKHAHTRVGCVKLECSHSSASKRTCCVRQVMRDEPLVCASGTSSATCVSSAWRPLLQWYIPAVP